MPKKGQETAGNNELISYVWKLIGVFPQDELKKNTSHSTPAVTRKASI